MAQPVARLLGMLLLARAAFATAGIAETSWSFHDQPGQWIEWHHGDICPPDAPHKECVFLRHSKAGARRPDSGQSEATPYAEDPRDLYLNTVVALLPVARGLRKDAPAPV